MRRTLPFAVCALAVGLLVGTSARAEEIPWGYEWAVSPGAVTAGSGSVQLEPEGYQTALDNSQIVATNLYVRSEANFATPDTFSPTDGKYSLTLTLHDLNSGTSGQFTFSGQMQGYFSNSNANVTNVFDSPIEQQLLLGNTLYTVTMTSFTPPGPPSQGNKGSIGAYVTAQPAGAHHAPEPSSLVLCGLGAGVAGLMGWRRRKLR